MSDSDGTLPHVAMLMVELETLLLQIKEASIPVLTSRDPGLEAWRARRFLRLADRMLEDMHDLLVGS
jgi:hypothetical protein